MEECRSIQSLLKSKDRLCLLYLHLQDGCFPPEFQLPEQSGVRLIMSPWCRSVQVEESKRKADDTERALRAVGAKYSELEATISNLNSSQSSSEDQLRSQAAQVSSLLSLPVSPKDIGAVQHQDTSVPASVVMPHR